MSPLRTIADLRPGDHLSFLYDSEEEHRAVLTPFLRHGLERGEKVVYLADAHPPEAILGYLRDEGLQVDTYLASKQLTLLPAVEAYMPAGEFDPDAVSQRIPAESAQARGDGFSALRVTGEMTWALRSQVSPAALLQHEATADRLLPDSLCLGLCQYDRRRFDPATLLDVIATHPAIIVGMALCPNHYYVPPGDFLKWRPPAETLHYRLQNLLARWQEQAQTEQQQFLAQASSLLASSLQYESTLAGVARLAVPALADWCVVDSLEGDAVRPVAAAHADPAQEKVLWEAMQRYPANVACDLPVAQVIRTGRPQLIPDVGDCLPAAAATDTEYRRLLRALRPRSVIVVPLLARGRILGAISLVAAGSGRRYGHGDLALAEELGRRAALAVDNARLYHEAEEAIQVRDEFLSLAAHELRTPVTSLRGFAQVTQRHLERGEALDRVRIQRALQVIDQQAEKLSRLVAQVLDVSRIDAGQLVLERQETDLARLVEEALANAQPNTSRHTFVLHAPSPVPAWVDPLRFEQVVTNLLDNAMRYSPNGGAIEIELSTPNPATARLAVRDHGIGIPPEHRQRIFERFYQAHTSFGGMGLGLFISRCIVDLHGGRIEVESPPDGGSRFVVTLPKDPDDAFRGEGRTV